VDYSTSRDEVDTSIHNEPLSYRNYIAGPASGEIALTINWLPSDPTHDNTNGLQSLYTSGLKKLMRLLWTGFNPDYSMTFTGFVRQWNVAAPAGTATAIQAQSVIRIDGTPTFA
jgi:hypothetical protein